MLDKIIKIWYNEGGTFYIDKSISIKIYWYYFDKKGCIFPSGVI